MPFFEVTSLEPFTQYEFLVESSTSVGPRQSSWVSELTLAGTPLSVLPPAVIGATAVGAQILMESPLVPRGVVIGITVFVNGTNVGTYPVGSYAVLAGLLPNTAYALAAEACTSAGCANSPTRIFTTDEAAPTHIAPPYVTGFAARNATVAWRAPDAPNGVVAQYTVQTEAFSECTALQSLDAVPVTAGCAYLVCGVGEHKCGPRCFANASQACCDGTVFDMQTGFSCCGSSYVRDQPGQTCCGAALVPSRIGFSCCGSVYSAVASGEICCNGAVGRGNMCCGTTAFLNTSTTPRVCCGDRVFSDSPQRQCCGGQMVPSNADCCTNANTDAARIYSRDEGKSCCGSQHIFANVTKCCDGIAHPFISAAVMASDTRICCGANLIPATSACCHGVGYDPSVSTCSDRPTDATSVDQCGGGTVCPLGQASSAFCDICGFNTGEASCFAVAETVVAAHASTFPYHTEDLGTVHTLAADYDACSLVVCGATESACNGTCHGDSQVCCDGALHTFDAGKQCCGELYLTATSPSDVCCGGVFHTREADRQCCGGSYAQVSVGQICCDGNVGVGTSCCGALAFTNSNEQPLLCCAGQLRNRDQTDVGQTCCGGAVVSGDMECCGGEALGQPHFRSSLMECCGTGYVSSSSALCCAAGTGEAISYTYSSPGAKIRAGDVCCGSHKVPGGTGCCNDMPFDATNALCADGGAAQQCSVAVTEGAVCDSSVGSAAQCGSCEYNSATSSCFLHRVSRPAPAYTCPSATPVGTQSIGASTSAVVSALLPFTPCVLPRAPVRAVPAAALRRIVRVYLWYCD